jgi:hypothetical protein
MKQPDDETDAAAERLERIAHARSEIVLDTGLEYRPGDPVCVRILRREHRVSVTDGGAAIEKAGRPPGWREVADRVARELIVNVGRHGVISLPVVAAGPGEEAIVQRIGRASVGLYQELLDLEFRAPSGDAAT